MGKLGELGGSAESENLTESLDKTDLKITQEYNFFLIGIEVKAGVEINNN
jgi:hypothetical protein